MNLRPLHDRVLIKPEKNPEQTESGLYLAEHPKPEETGTVVAVGRCEHPKRAEAMELADAIEALYDDGTQQAMLHEDALDGAKLLRELTQPVPLVKVGDYVIFSWKVGQEVRIEDERYLLMRETDISCVLEAETVT